MNLGLTAVSGLLLGFVGSFHCAGYCGAIASSLVLASPDRPRSSLRFVGHMLLPHMGRIAAYVAFGTAAGAAVDSVVRLAQFSGFRTVLVAMASVTLIWAAAAILRWIPETLGPNQLLAGRIRPIFNKITERSLLPLGLAWGCAPCGMVYSVLLSASLTGSPIGGALFMLGFGIATVPALLLVGVAQLAMMRGHLPRLQANVLRNVAGAVLMATAFTNLLVTSSGPVAELCLGH